MLLKKGGEARLSSVILEQRYGTRGWREMKELLVREGLLIVGESYQSNAGSGFCKRYAFGLICTNLVVNYPCSWVPGKTARRKNREAAIRNMSQAQLYVLSWLKHLTVEGDYGLAPFEDEVIRCLWSIDKGDWFYSPDCNGRLHHNMANLKREARTYLRLDGKPLVCCDYSSFHPCLILSMATNAEERARLARAIETNFYHSISGCTNKEERDIAKEEFNSGVNDRNRNAWKYPAWIEFKRQYPITAGMVMDFKSRDHRNAARILQRMESRLIFNEVIAELQSKSVPAISLHDAVYTTPEHEETVRLAMIGAAQRTLGIQVRA